jgi:hypothetical protein
MDISQNAVVGIHIEVYIEVYMEGICFISEAGKRKTGWADLNRRPLVPQARTMPKTASLYGPRVGRKRMGVNS